MSVVQCTCCGTMGRLGNSLHQAAFARAYAEAHGHELELPEAWEGRWLFEGWDQFPAISTFLPKTACGEVPDGRGEIDLFGYWQTQRAIDYLTVEQCREWFRYSQEGEQMSRVPMGHPYCVVHKRRGDYLTRLPHVYVVVGDKCYEDIVTLVLDMTNRPMPVIECTDAGERTVYHDFWLMRHADVLFRANSTLSWWAGLLNERGEVWAPVVKGLAPGPCDAVGWVQGNWPALVDLPNVTDLRVRHHANLAAT